jgi:2-dehydropantoate 2-reductase
LAAHTLAIIPERPAVSLLLYRSTLVGEYKRNGDKLVLNNREGQSITHTGYDLEVLRDSKWYTADLDAYAPETTEPQQLSKYSIDHTISDLIVSFKSTQTVGALQPLLPRLSRRSNVVFL